MIVQTPEEYIKGFPHKVLPKIHGAPNYQSIRLVNKKLAANASTIKTTLGGGRHGYLALCMSPTAYSSYSLIAFVPPVNPGPIPTFPIRATAVTVAALEATHKENLRAWEEYNAVMQALKNQLIEAVDELYFKAIQDRVTEYTNVTLYSMLQHLYDNYGKITEDKLEQNREEMNSPFDVSLPIEILFTQIEDCVDFADAARSPYSQAQILNTAFLLIQKTGIFNKECRNWRKKLPADKTWANFKTFFKEAYDDYREDNQMTASHTGYNIVDEQDTNETTTLDALEHLAAATAADRTAVANLTSANAKLSQELQTKNKSYQELQKSLERVQAQLSELQLQQQQRSAQVPPIQQQTQYFQPHQPAQTQPSPAPFFRPPSRGRGRRGRGRGQGRGRQAYNSNYQYQFPPFAPQNSAQPIPQQQQPQTYQIQTYCWTHGVTNNPSHTSQTCRNPAPGHQLNATIHNTMNGNTFGFPF